MAFGKCNLKSAKISSVVTLELVPLDIVAEVVSVGPNQSNVIRIILQELIKI